MTDRITANILGLAISVIFTFTAVLAVQRS